MKLIGKLILMSFGNGAKRKRRMDFFGEINFSSKFIPAMISFDRRTPPSSHVLKNQKISLPPY